MPVSEGCQNIGAGESVIPKKGILPQIDGSRHDWAELARLMGVTQPSVARMETGPFDPRLTTPRRLTVALGVRFEIGAAGLRVISFEKKVAAR